MAVSLERGAIEDVSGEEDIFWNVWTRGAVLYRSHLALTSENWDSGRTYGNFDFVTG